MHSSGKHESFLRQLSPRVALVIALRIVLILCLFQLPALTQQNASEDQVKAAYLLNFAKLAEWPRRAMPDGSSPVVICVIGGDPSFLDVLKAVVAGKIVGPHPVAVKSVSSVENRDSCRIIFFRASEKKHAQAGVEGLAQAGVLFVGEDESFLGQGGMINLVRDHGRIHFEVNAEALDRAEIHFSSRILALAKTGSGTSPAAASTPAAESGRPLVRSMEPEYPTLAERMKLSGTVQVQAVVKPDGTVKAVNIVGGHPLLAAAVATAVMQWKYQPAQKETVEVVKFTFAPR
jgi:TonB family protein